MNLPKTILTLVIGSFLLIATNAEVSAQRQQMPVNRTAPLEKAMLAPEEKDNQERPGSFEEAAHLVADMLKNQAKVVFIRDPELGFSPAGLKQKENEVVIKECSVLLKNKDTLNQKIAFQFSDVDSASINLTKSHHNYYFSNSEKTVINSYTFSFQTSGMQRSFAYTDDMLNARTGFKEYRGSSLRITFPRTDDSNIEESEAARRFERTFRYAVELCSKR